MKSLRSGRAALVLVTALVACATQTQTQTGVMSQQPASACFRGGVPCTTEADCCSRRCENAACLARTLETPESIESHSPDDMPTEPTSGLGTPGGYERAPK